MKKLIARRNRFPFVRPVHPRRILTVRMDTTNYCNLRCSMCPMRLSDNDSSRQWKHMSADVFQKIRTDVFPLARTVGISCGAEPLTNPDFGNHLQTLYKSGVPYRQMVTNGTLLTTELIQMILRHPPTSLFISIDGADCKTHGSIRDGADLDRILAMTGILVARRGKRIFPMIGFSTTLQRDNLHQITDIVRLASKTGAVSVGVVPLVPYEGLNTLDRVVDTGSREAEKEILKARLTASELEIEFHLSSEMSDRASAHPCPYLLNTLFIDADGSIFPCPYWNTEHPVGNILEGFEKVWNGAEYLRLRSGHFAKPDNCLQCPEVTSRTVEVLKAKQ
ncbi:MAG: radical SAM protein [Candidatus Sabulitectum sp.]|nr:radical SAM protein [Candidatus Sabulitectum sp.]